MLRTSGVGTRGIEIDIRNVDRVAVKESTTRTGTALRPHGLLLEGCHRFSVDVVISNNLEKLAIVLANMTLIGPGELHGAFDYGIEHWL